MSAAPNSERLLSRCAVREFLGFKGFQPLYNLLRKDPTFPKPFAATSKFSPRWRYSELVAWAEAKSQQRLDIVSGVSIVDRRRQAKGRKEASHHAAG